MEANRRQSFLPQYAVEDGGLMAGVKESAGCVREYEVVICPLLACRSAGERLPISMTPKCGDRSLAEYDRAARSRSLGLDQYKPSFFLTLKCPSNVESASVQVNVFPLQRLV